MKHTYSTRNTIAGRIAARFGNDGTAFAAPDGTSIEAACREYGGFLDRARIAYDEDGEAQAIYDPVGDLSRFTFVDGSAIILSGAAWDLEGRKPFSWKGAE